MKSKEGMTVSLVVQFMNWGACDGKSGWVGAGGASERKQVVFEGEVSRYWRKETWVSSLSRRCQIRVGT